MKKTSIIEKEINPSRSAIERKTLLNRSYLPATGPLDSEPAVDLVVDLAVVVRNKRFDFITTVPLSSSPARKVAGAQRQPARDRGINGGDPRSGVAAVYAAKRPCRLPAPASLADQATNLGEGW